MTQSHNLSHAEVGEAVIEYARKRARLPDGEYTVTVTWHADRDYRTQTLTITAQCSFEPKRKEAPR